MTLSFAGEASAQMQWTDRLFINVSGGVQTGTKTLETTFTSPLYDETLSVETAQDIKGGGLFDLTVGTRIRGNFGAAFSFSALSSTNDAAVTASVPDPVFFDQPRIVSSTVAGLEHKESWYGFNAVWFVPVGEKIDLMLMGGPAVAAVKQDLPVGATVTETGGAPQVTLSLDQVSKSFWGVQIGADIRYMLHTNFGVGGFARYSGASGQLNDSDFSVGGFQIGGGVRIRF